MYTLVYSGHVEYDKNNAFTSLKVHDAAPWSHRGQLEHHLRPVYLTSMITTAIHMSHNHLYSLCEQQSYYRVGKMDVNSIVEVYNHLRMVD